MSLTPYYVGQPLLWTPARRHEASLEVVVEELRSRGAAKLSNGWVVDEGGIAEGTQRQPGGTVTDPKAMAP